MTDKDIINRLMSMTEQQLHSRAMEMDIDPAGLSQKRLIREMMDAGEIAKLTGNFEQRDFLHDEATLHDDNGNEHTEYTLRGSAQLSTGAIMAAELRNSGLGAAWMALQYIGDDATRNKLTNTLLKSGVSVDDVQNMNLHLSGLKGQAEISSGEHERLSRAIGAMSKSHDASGQITGHADTLRNITDKFSAEEFSYEYDGKIINAEQSLRGFAAKYLDEDSYESSKDYRNDLTRVQTRLQNQLHANLRNVAGMFAEGGKGSYLDALPHVGDESIIAGIKHPSPALTASGNEVFKDLSPDAPEKYQYSHAASLTGMVVDNREGSRFRDEIGKLRSHAKSLAGIYGVGSEKGNRTNFIETHRGREEGSRLGLSSGPASFSDEEGYARDDIARSMDSDDTQIGDHNILNEAMFGRRTLEEEVSKQKEYVDNFVGPKLKAGIKILSPREARKASRQATTGTIEPSTPSIASGFQFAPEGTRGSADITASMVGAILGHNKNQTPEEAVLRKLRLDDDVVQNIFNEDTQRGNRLEGVTRAWAEKQLGQTISQVGFTEGQGDFAGLGFAPDGVMADGGLFEAKAPRTLFDIEKKPEYMDQMQFQMAITGAPHTYLAQIQQGYGTYNPDQFKLDKIQADPKWMEQNAERIQDAQRRISRIRQFTEANPNLSREELRNGALGIWNTNVTPDPNQIVGPHRYENSPNPEEFVGPIPEDTRDRDNPNFMGPMQPPNTMGYNPVRGFMGPPLPIGGEGGGSPEDRMAAAVEKGVTASRRKAREEEDTLGEASAFSRAFGDKGKGIDFGGAANSIAAGVASGSMGGLASGAFGALGVFGPVGKIAQVAIGGAMIGSEVVDTLNDVVGNSEDIGVDNAYLTLASRQNLEQSGLSRPQAEAITNRFGNASAQMSIGDPSQAVQLVTGTMGLITLQDIHDAGDDASIVVQKAADEAKRRGWTQQQFAGAMSRSGLSGAARAWSNSDDTVIANSDRSISARDEDGTAAREGVRSALGVTVGNSPVYGGMRLGLHTFAGGNRAIESGEQFISESWEKFEDAIGGVESGNRSYNADGSLITNPKSGAQGKMQVMPGTNLNPGYEVKGARDDSEEERIRVGNDYLDAMYKEFDHDPVKAAAAYNWGPGNLKKAVSKYGDSWLQHAPEETQGYIRKLKAAGALDSNGGLAGQSYGQQYAANAMQQGSAPPTSVIVNLTVANNGNVANASAEVNGVKATQSVNVNGAAMKKR